MKVNIFLQTHDAAGLPVTTSIDIDVPEHDDPNKAFVAAISKAMLPLAHSLGIDVIEIMRTQIDATLESMSKAMAGSTKPPPEVKDQVLPSPVCGGCGHRFDHHDGMTGKCWKHECPCRAYRPSEEL